MHIWILRYVCVENQPATVIIHTMAMGSMSVRACVIVFMNEIKKPHEDQNKQCQRRYSTLMVNSQRIDEKRFYFIFAKV